MPLKKTPLVSVVMSVYDGARFLDEAIESIRNQSYENFEFIIVDDGSRDATPEILARHAAQDSRIRVLTQQNKGLIESLHRGFAGATCEYVARMDADDVSKPERLEMQLDFLTSNAGIALVGGAVEIIDSESRVFDTVWLPHHPEELRRDLRGYGNAIAHPTVLFRRAVLEEVGGFRKAYQHAEDYDLWLRMLEKFDLANLRAVLLGYRRHEGSVSFKYVKQQALSVLCARTTAQLRLRGIPDPTSDIELVTEAVLHGLGVTREAVDEAIFKGLKNMTEDAIGCGLCSVAAEFPRLARPHASPAMLARMSFELNRKAAEAPGAPSEKRRHKLLLMTTDPTTFRELFGTEATLSNGEWASVRKDTSAKKDETRFSVLMPVYNHARYVRQAVMSALRSPLVSEVILVDDGSDDNSANILKELETRSPGRVRNLTKKGNCNRGAHYRLNELVEAAKCSWIAILNSDDVFVNGRFASIADHCSLSENDFIFGNLLFIDSAGTLVGAKRGPLDPGVPFPSEFKVEEILQSGSLLDLLAHQNWIGSTSNMIFTKALHSRLGGFAAFRYVHDWDFALRALALGRWSYVRRYLTAYRLHARNTIAEGFADVRVKAESQLLFDRLLKDLPELADRPHFQIGLQQNVHLASNSLTRKPIT